MACNPLPFVFPLGNLSSEETEASLMLPAPIVWVKVFVACIADTHYEQESNHLSSRSKRPRMKLTSETSVFNLL